MNQWKNLTNGLLKENPVFVLILGMCPTLAVTTSVQNGLGMGLSTLFVLMMSNLVISSLKHMIPDKVRIPCFIVVIASFVTMVDLVMAGYFPAIHAQLGIFIPLIVVNCIVLGRAEAFAARQRLFSSFVDGLGMGAGFTLAIIVISAIREILGTGAIAGHKLSSFDGVLVFVLAPGAFMVVGYLIAIVNHLNKLFNKGSA